MGEMHLEISTKKGVQYLVYQLIDKHQLNFFLRRWSIHPNFLSNIPKKKKVLTKCDKTMSDDLEILLSPKKKFLQKK